MLIKIIYDLVQLTKRRRAKPAVDARTAAYMAECRNEWDRAHYIYSRSLSRPSSWNSRTN